MTEYYLAETCALRHGVRQYVGTQEQLESLQRKLSEDLIWHSVFPNPGNLYPVKLLGECLEMYPLIRLNYLDLNGDMYKLRADDAVLHYLWIEHNGRWYRMVRPEMRIPKWDREDSPHGWHALPRSFLGVPHLLSWDGVMLTGNCYFLDESFMSRREALADYYTLPPAINLQCTFDEVFSPA